MYFAALYCVVLFWAVLYWTVLECSGTPTPIQGAPDHGTTRWSAAELGPVRLPHLGTPPWGGVLVSPGCPSALGFRAPPRGGVALVRGHSGPHPGALRLARKGGLQARGEVRSPQANRGGDVGGARTTLPRGSSLVPLEDGWHAALSTSLGRAWALWTKTAEDTLLALSCLDIAPDALPAGAALPLAPPHHRWPSCTCSWARGLTSGSTSCAYARGSEGTPRNPSPAPRCASRPPKGPFGASLAGWSDRRMVWAPRRAGCSRRGQHSGTTIPASALCAPPEV